jgi:hypothetical protein
MKMFQCIYTCSEHSGRKELMMMVWRKKESTNYRGRGSYYTLGGEIGDSRFYAKA